MGNGNNGNNDKVVLGVHSSINPGTQGSVDQLTDGHAWISVTRNGQTQFYGLWPDSHPNVRDNGSGTDIRVGMEAGATPTASRYYELNAEQVARLETKLRENVTWGYTNTCASWASDTARQVTGERLDASELMGLTDTPRQLINAINERERQRDTTPTNPLQSDEIKRSSSFGAVDTPSSQAQYANVISPEHARYGDYQRIRATVATDGTYSGQELDNVAAAAFSRLSELPRLDHVGIYSGNVVGTYAPSGLGVEPMHNARVEMANVKDLPAAESMVVAQQTLQQRDQAIAQQDNPTTGPRMT